MSIASSRPSASMRGPMPRPRRMPLGGRDHVFGAVVDHLDRPARLPREQRRMPGDQRWILFLAAEAAARLHLHDANLVGAGCRRAAPARCGRNTGTASSPRRSRRPRGSRRPACRSARCTAVPARRSRTPPRRQSPRRRTPRPRRRVTPVYDLKMLSVPQTTRSARQRRIDREDGRLRLHPYVHVPPAFLDHHAIPMRQQQRSALLDD